MAVRKSPLRTPALLAANRANARKSTGPRSARGKARSCLNALRTGHYVSDLRGKLDRLGDIDAVFLLDWIYTHQFTRFISTSPRHREQDRRWSSRLWCEMTAQGRCARRSLLPSPRLSKSFGLSRFWTRTVVRNHHGSGIIFWNPYRSPYASRPDHAPLVPAFIYVYGDDSKLTNRHSDRPKVQRSAIGGESSAQSGQWKSCPGEGMRSSHPSVTQSPGHPIPGCPGTKPECHLESEGSWLTRPRSMSWDGGEQDGQRPGIDSEWAGDEEESADASPYGLGLEWLSQEDGPESEAVAELALSDPDYAGTLARLAARQGPEVLRLLLDRLARNCRALRDA